MNSLSILNLVTAILGFCVSCMLIFSAGQNRFINRFLGIGFFAVAYRSLTFYALHANLIENNFLMGSLSYLYYFAPFSIYLYFRCMIHDEQKLRKSDWIHFIAPACALLLLFYYMYMGFHLHGKIVLPAHQTLFTHKQEFPLHILPKYHALVLFILCIVYIIASWRIVFNKLLRQDTGHPQVKIMRQWVLTLLLSCSALVIVVFASIFLVLYLKVELIYLMNPDIVRSALLMFVFSRVLFKPDLLYGMPSIRTNLPVVDEMRGGMAGHPDMQQHSPEPAFVPEKLVPAQQVAVQSESEKEAVAKKETAPVNVKKLVDLPYFDMYGWIHVQHIEGAENQVIQNNVAVPIEKDKVEFYIDRINEYLKGLPYTDPDFDMKTISDALQYPLYHIEFLFRYYNQYSFPEFRNVMRVQYVLNEFQRGVSQHYTVEAIGLRAGFSSRSSFFRVFKDITGQTPKQVIEELDSHRH